MSHQENKLDKRICYVLITPLVVLMLQYFLLVNFNAFSSSLASIIQNTSKFLVALSIFLVLPIILKRSFKTIFLAYYISIIIFLITIIVYPQNTSTLIGLAGEFYFICLPFFIVAYSIKNWKNLEGAMNIASNIIFALGLLVAINIMTNNFIFQTYSMAISYYLLFPLIINLNKIIDKPNIRNVTITLITLLIILALGSRGALLCALIFFILKLLNNVRDLKPLNLYFSLVLVITLSILYFLKDQLIMYLILIFSKLNIDSRTLNLFLEEETHLSGRENLYSSLIEVIEEAPLLGLGIAGDRVVLGTYSHNFFLEIISHFGIIVGILIIIIFMRLLIKRFLILSRKDADVLLIWLSIGWLPLLVSGSYLTDFKFWMFLGITSGLYIKQNYFIK